jgi:hypothetical protein
VLKEPSGTYVAPDGRACTYRVRVGK